MHTLVRYIAIRISFRISSISSPVYRGRRRAKRPAEPPFQSLRPEQPRHLDDQCTRRQFRPALAERAGVPVFRVDDEYLAPWRPLPPKPEVPTDHLTSAAVLHESAHIRARRHRIRHTRPADVLVVLPGVRLPWQVDPVE